MTKTFKELRDEAYELWREQKEAARTAEALLDRCEKIEDQIVDIVMTMQTDFPDDFSEFVQEFNTQQVVSAEEAVKVEMKDITNEN